MTIDDLADQVFKLSSIVEELADDLHEHLQKLLDTHSGLFRCLKEISRRSGRVWDDLHPEIRDQLKSPQEGQEK